MPGHTTLWTPDRYIIALRNNASVLQKQGFGLMANELEGAARMLHKYVEWEKDMEKKEVKRETFEPMVYTCGDKSYTVNTKVTYSDGTVRLFHE